MKKYPSKGSRGERRFEGYFAIFFQRPLPLLVMLGAAGEDGAVGRAGASGTSGGETEDVSRSSLSAAPPGNVRESVSPGRGASLSVSAQLGWMDDDDDVSLSASRREEGVSVSLDDAASEDRRDDDALLPAEEFPAAEGRVTGSED